MSEDTRLLGSLLSAIAAVLWRRTTLALIVLLSRAHGESHYAGLVEDLNEVDARCGALDGRIGHAHARTAALGTRLDEVAALAGRMLERLDDLEDTQHGDPEASVAASERITARIDARTGPPSSARLGE